MSQRLRCCVDGYCTFLWWRASWLNWFIEERTTVKQRQSFPKNCCAYTRLPCFCCGALSLDCGNFSDLLGLLWMLLGKCKCICNNAESSLSFLKTITELRTKYFCKCSLIHSASVLDEGYSKHAFLLESKTFICTSSCFVLMNYVQ